MTARTDVEETLSELVSGSRLWFSPEIFPGGKLIRERERVKGGGHIEDTLYRALNKILIVMQCVRPHTRSILDVHLTCSRTYTKDYPSKRICSAAISIKSKTPRDTEAKFLAHVWDSISRKKDLSAACTFYEHTLINNREMDRTAISRHNVYGDLDFDVGYFVLLLLGNDEVNWFLKNDFLKTVLWKLCNLSKNHFFQWLTVTITRQNIQLWRWISAFR